MKRFNQQSHKKIINRGNNIEENIRQKESKKNNSTTLHSHKVL